MEKNKKIMIAFAAIVLLGAGYIFVPKIYSNIQAQRTKAAYESLIKINTALTMKPSQIKTYDSVKSKLGKNIEDLEGLAELARLKQDLLDFDGAIAIYQKLRIMDPKNITTLNNLGTIYYNQKNYAESEKMYLAILDITPKWISSYRELASIYTYHLKDKAPQFEAILLKGQEQYPEMANDFIGLLAVYYDEMVPNKEKAIQYYEKLVVLYPQDAGFSERLKELKKL